MMAVMTKETVFGANLTKALERKGVTKYRLSKLSGLNESYIGKVLRGEVGISPAFIEAIAPHVDVPTEELKAWADVDAIGMDGVERIKRYVLGINQQIDEDASALLRLKAERRSLLKLPATEATESRLDDIDAEIDRLTVALRLGTESLFQAAEELPAATDKLPQEERELLDWLRKFTPEQLANLRRLTPDQVGALGHFLRP